LAGPAHPHETSLGSGSIWGTKIEIVALDAQGARFCAGGSDAAGRLSATLDAWRISSAAERDIGDRNRGHAADLARDWALRGCTGLPHRPAPRDLERGWAEVRVTNDANCFALPRRARRPGEGGLGAILGTGVGRVS
jgi:hypothetical protein